MDDKEKAIFQQDERRKMVNVWYNCISEVFFRRLHFMAEIENSDLVMIFNAGVI